jgi:O-antigen ligase
MPRKIYILSSTLIGTSWLLAVFGNIAAAFISIALSGIIGSRQYMADMIINRRLVCLYLLTNLSFLASILVRDATGELPLLVGISLYCLLVYLSVLLSKRHLKYAFIIFSMGFLYTCAQIIIQEAMQPGAAAQSQANMLGAVAIVAPNDYSLFLMCLPFVFYSLSEFHVHHTNLIVSIILFMAIFSALALESRLSLLLISAIAVYELRRRYLKAWHQFLIPTISIIALLSFFLGISVKMTSLPTSRIPVWHAGLLQISENPIWGSGIDSFRNFYWKHINSTSYSDLIVVDTRSMPWPHNILIEVAGSFGLLVACTCVMLLCYSAIELRRHKCRLHSYSLLAFGCFCIASLVELSILRVYPLVFITIVAGIASSHERNRAPCNNEIGHEK